MPRIEIYHFFFNFQPSFSVIVLIFSRVLRRCFRASEKSRRAIKNKVWTDKIFNGAFPKRKTHFMIAGSFPSVFPEAHFHLGPFAECLPFSSKRDKKKREFYSGQISSFRFKLAYDISASFLLRKKKIYILILWSR